MDRLDILERRLDWAIRIGSVVAVLLLALGYDASYKIREEAERAHRRSQENRDILDSLLRFYLADSLDQRR